MSRNCSDSESVKPALARLMTMIVHSTQMEKPRFSAKIERIRFFLAIFLPLRLPERLVVGFPVIDPAAPAPASGRRRRVGRASPSSCSCTCSSSSGCESGMPHASSSPISALCANCVELREPRVALRASARTDGAHVARRAERAARLRPSPGNATRRRCSAGRRRRTTRRELPARAPSPGGARPVHRARPSPCGRSPSTSRERRGLHAAAHREAAPRGHPLGRAQRQPRRDLHGRGAAS